MRTYLHVRGKQGVLIGNPFSDKFLGQQLKVLADGERPKNIAGMYEPAESVVPKHADILKHIKRNELELVESFEAPNYQTALKKLDGKQVVKVKEIKQ